MEWKPTAVIVIFRNVTNHINKKGFNLVYVNTVVGLCLVSENLYLLFTD